MKLEEILKKKGYTDADMKAMEPMLTDQRLRTTLEEEYGAVSSEAAAARAEAEKWAKWHKDDAVPTIDMYLKEKNDAIARAAAAEARLTEAEKAGFAPAGSAPPKQDPAPGDAFDPKKHKLVTEDDLKAGYHRFADLEGEAIALASDLGDMYRKYHPGQSLADYQGQDGKTGMRALRAEAIAAKKPVDLYVAEKFNFSGKRAEADAARQKAAEDAVRADERSKIMAEFGNPSMRQASPSSQPFIPPKAKDGGQPWQQTPTQLKERRLGKFMDLQSKAN